MNTRILGLLLAPLLLLGTACEEQTVVAPEDPSFAKNSKGSNSPYDAVVLDGGNGNAYAINDAGIAVGMGREGKGSDPYPALRWVVTTEGVTGPEALPMLDGVFSHQPVAINSSGVITGYFQKDNRWGAFIYSDELQMQALPQFASTDESFAWDINDVGIVAGSVTSTVLDEEGNEVDRLSRATVWVNTHDEPTVLPLPEGYTSAGAGAINGEGLVAGSASGSGVPSVALAWVIDNAGQLLEGPHELAAGFVPTAVNAEGDIVGTYGSWCVSALMRNDVLIVLDPLDPDDCTHPEDISDAAPDGTVQIVDHYRPALWTVDAGGQVSAPVDLGIPKGTTGAYARGMNAQGWIVGAGRTSHGDVPALWMPKASADDGGDDGDECTHPRGKC